MGSQKEGVVGKRKEARVESFGSRFLSPIPTRRPVVNGRTPFPTMHRMPWKAKYRITLSQTNPDDYSMTKKKGEGVVDDGYDGGRRGGEP